MRLYFNNIVTITTIWCFTYIHIFAYFNHNLQLTLFSLYNMYIVDIMYIITCIKTITISIYKMQIFTQFDFQKKFSNLLTYLLSM